MTELTEAERLKIFLAIVRKIPPTWTCLDCKQTFSTAPNGTPPYATQTQTDDKGVRTIVGEICKSCYDKKGTG